jgi:uncharacterized metal-binding protein
MKTAARLFKGLAGQARLKSGVSAVQLNNHIASLEETMTQECCQPQVDTIILACAGGSNVGQLSNQAAVELTQEGFGKLFCLAGVGAHLSGFIKAVSDIPQLVVIDGCEIGCAKGILEQAEVPLRSHLVITDLGITKNKDMNLKREEIDRVKQAVKDLPGE